MLGAFSVPTEDVGVAQNSRYTNRNSAIQSRVFLKKESFDRSHGFTDHDVGGIGTRYGCADKCARTNDREAKIQ